MAELHAYDDIKCFPEDNEFYDRGSYPPELKGQPEYLLNKGDVLKVVSKPKDEQGLHTVVATGLPERGMFRVPPNALITLSKVHEPGTWEPYPGRFPNRRCIEVTVSYLPMPSAIADAAQESEAKSTKMVSRATELSFEKRLVYMRGISDLTGELVLTMEQEWMRGDTWKARDGKEFSSIEEFSYCNGVANANLQTFAGTRDQNNVGMTPEDFMERINTFMITRGAEVGVEVTEKHLLNRDEVIGLRLYTGPAYQPLNEWLRNVGKLQPSLRSKLAVSPNLTYGATTKAIVSGIRKLSRVGNAKLDNCILYRGISGVLPETFWTPDDAGIVCATDLGFMSTSLNSTTPVHYMRAGSPNLLWQIHATKEDNVAYHCGAVISDLSQYAGEDEVLFPPLTMLKVRSRRAEETTDGLDAMTEPRTWKQQHAWGVTELNSAGKDYKQVAVVPYFI